MLQAPLKVAARRLHSRSFESNGVSQIAEYRLTHFGESLSVTSSAVVRVSARKQLRRFPNREYVSIRKELGQIHPFGEDGICRPRGCFPDENLKIVVNHPSRRGADLG